MKPSQWSFTHPALHPVLLSSWIHWLFERVFISFRFTPSAWRCLCSAVVPLDLILYHLPFIYFFNSSSHSRAQRQVYQGPGGWGCWAFAVLFTPLLPLLFVQHSSYLSLQYFCFSDIYCDKSSNLLLSVKSSCSRIGKSANRMEYFMLCFDT